MADGESGQTSTEAATERNVSVWTGGQYSLFRYVAGVWLFACLAWHVPGAGLRFAMMTSTADAPRLLAYFPNLLSVWHQPTFVTALFVVGAVLSLMFAAGNYDRFAAVVVAYLLGCLVATRPDLVDVSMLLVSGLLLVHACLPGSPYGSYAARGRDDPDGGWRLPAPLYVLGWIALAAVYAWDGYLKATDPAWRSGQALSAALPAWPTWSQQALAWWVITVELAFAPLALLPWTRPWVWCAGMLLAVRFITADTSAHLAGVFVLQLFTFDPRWIRPRDAGACEMVYYDGHCGLCHSSVRFVLAEDRDESFTFAPLHGHVFEEAIPQARREQLPDGVVVQTRDGRLLCRSQAVRHMLARLGGVWRIIGCVMGIVPRPILDLAYTAIAAVRYRLFGRPQDVCPLIPPRLRARFRL